MRKTSISVFICLGLVAIASPAYAHNQLISTSPTDGSTVEAGSVNIDLTFEEDPLTLPFGEGNLIAIANADTGEQLGAACATQDGTHLSTTANLDAPGDYKVLWRQVSDDGHVVSGEFKFTLVNTTGYKADVVGNQCFDETGKALDVATQKPLSTKTSNNFIPGMFWAIGIIILGSVIGGFIIRRRQR